MQRYDKVKVGSRLFSHTSAYTVRRILSSEAFGTVALCYKSRTHRIVELKVLKDNQNNNVELNEAKILQKLQKRDSGSHHIVQCVDSFQYDGHLCQEFERLDMSLKDFLEICPFGRLQPKEIRATVAQMARALAFLKKEGVVHGNLKPNNIMMTDHVKRPLRIKLTDFGLACSVKEAKHGARMQTFYYSAPEVQVGGAITEAIDVWSVGCIAAEMFLGKYLFCGNDDYDLMTHISQTGAPSPKRVLSM